MKRLLLCIAASLALLVGHNVTPVDAHVLAPGQLSFDQPAGFYGLCPTVAVYGTYGNGFAQIKMGNGCNVWTSVMVRTAHDGHIHEQWCNLLHEALYDDPWCTWDPVHGTLMAYAPGDAFAMVNQPCIDAIPPTPSTAFCVYWEHGAYGGAHR